MPEGGSHRQEVLMNAMTAEIRGHQSVDRHRQARLGNSAAGAIAGVLAFLLLLLSLPGFAASGSGNALDAPAPLPAPAPAGSR